MTRKTRGNGHLHFLSIWFGFFCKKYFNKCELNETCRLINRKKDNIFQWLECIKGKKNWIMIFSNPLSRTNFGSIIVWGWNNVRRNLFFHIIFIIIRSYAYFMAKNVKMNGWPKNIFSFELHFYIFIIKIMWK